MTQILISIDGPTASGKTTLGVGLAKALGISFLDTGLTYRGAALAAHRDPHSFCASNIFDLVEHRPAVYGSSASGGEILQPEMVLFKGVEVTDDIWGPELEGSLKQVAADSERRIQILEMHKSILEESTNVVAVGRDVAVTLLPVATLHIYLTASLIVRRERRRAQYRNEPSRSIAVGPATERDIENRAAVRVLPNSLEIESTYLPALAVFARAFTELEGNFNEQQT